MIVDLEHHMRKLAAASGGDPHGRVFVWRKILTEMWVDGFEAGRDAERRDMRVVAELEKAERVNLNVADDHA
ncbi:hypothetical protein [Acrocarpospora sp. B8E8]|uniref:hypothetical protein n=1 Tax=Acrocarpospora sp. B8E8 TaxID=3153572 RepID=UPI00325CC37F